MSLTVNSGYNVNFGVNGGNGILMTVNTNGVYINTCSNYNSCNFYCYPNSINNSNGNSNYFNLNAACNTTNTPALSSFISVQVPDGWNGINKIVTLACTGSANSGTANSSRMILDGSYSTNSGRGQYGSYICWQSLNSGGWTTNMELYTNTSPILTTTLNVGGSVKSNGVTLTSSANIKSNVRDIYDPLDLINKFEGKHYHNLLTGQKDFGLIAEDIEQICPCLTSRYNDSGVDIGVKYMNLTAVLIEGIKAQQILINNMQTQINTI